MPITPDRSIVSKNGILKFCSTERFVRDICLGSSCFICGRSGEQVGFNKEHVLPNWMLRQFKLHGSTVTLPNRNQHAYGTYKIPCCADCNGELSRIFETPLSEAFAKGFSGVEKFVEREGATKMFLWLAQIFLKMHLKDRLLRMNLDPRLGEQPISADYDWQTFHHIHCLARAHHTDARLGDATTGSLMIAELIPDNDEEPFDVMSISEASTIMLRAGDLAVFAVLNDGGACLGAITPLLDRIKGVMRPIQARELGAELAAAKLHLENPPAFQTLMDDEDGADVRIVAHLDAAGPRFLEKDAEIVGRVKSFAFQHHLDSVHGRSRDEALNLIRMNRLSFLFDDDGEFIKDLATPRE